MCFQGMHVLLKYTFYTSLMEEILGKNVEVIEALWCKSFIPRSSTGEKERGMPLFFFFFLRKRHNTEQHWFCTAVCVLCLAFKTHNQRLLFHRACFCAHIDGLEMKDLKYKA